MTQIAPFAVLALLLVLPPLAATGQLPPVTDLLAIGEGGGQTPPTAELQRNPEPPLSATPRAECGPGSKPEPGIQGRVPAGAAANGLHCNLDLISHQGQSGGSRSSATSTPGVTSAPSTTPRCSSRSMR